MIRRLTAATLALALGLGTLFAERGAQSAPEPLDVDHMYDIYIGGLWLAEMSVNADFDGTRYTANARLETTGVVGRFFKASFEAQAEGAQNGTGYQPDLFVADSRDTRKSQHVEMTYAQGRPASLIAEPEFKPKPWEIDPLAQQGTADPLSAALEFLANQEDGKLCNRGVEIFDGRKRYAIELKEPVKREEGIRCDAVYRRIAGFKPKKMEDPEFPFAFWFQQAENGSWEVLRAVGDTPLGTAVIRRRKGR